jgi:hypothetical protein
LDINITTNVQIDSRSVTSPRENILSPKLKSPASIGRRLSSTSFGTSSSQEVAIAKAVQQRTVSSTSDNGEESINSGGHGRRLGVRRSTSNEARLSAVPTSSSTRATGKGDEANINDNDSFLDEELDDLLGDITSLPPAAHDSPQTEAEDDALLLEMEELLS